MEDLLAACQQARSKSHEAVQSWTQAARLFFEICAYTEAQRLCQQAINLNPSSGPAHLQIGRAPVGHGQYDDALKVLERAA
jgi:tetratricopeptide (TPR) repeat protein